MLHTLLLLKIYIVGVFCSLLFWKYNRRERGNPLPAVEDAYET
jgi:hypothetical protein